MSFRIPATGIALIGAIVASISALQSPVFAAVRSPHIPIVFIADTPTNSVYALNANNLHAPPLAKINSGINNPTALAVDTNGVLYVSSTNTVTEYQPGSLTLFRTLSFSQGEPGALTVGSDATLAVAEQPGVGSPGHVVIFDKGSLTPTRTVELSLDGQLAVFVGGVAIDSTGDVFVSVAHYPKRLPHHLKIQPGSTQGTDTGLPVGTSEGFDGQGNFYIGLGAGISVFAPGSIQPFRVISRGLTNSGIFAVSAAGGLFVPNTAFGQSRGDLVEYAPGRQTPVAKLSSNIDLDPRAAALRP